MDLARDENSLRNWTKQEKKASKQWAQVWASGRTHLGAGQCCLLPWMPGLAGMKTHNLLNSILIIKLDHACVCAQSCPILCNPMDCIPSGSSIHGIFQARILEWVAISFSRESSWPRDRTQVSRVSCIGRWILYHCTTWGARAPY